MTTKTINTAEALAAYFKTAPTYCRPYGNGHINDTFLVVADKRYIMQRMNTKIFTKPVELMANILGVTEHIRKKAEAMGRADVERASLVVVPTVDGKKFFVDSEGSYWRVYEFTEHTVTQEVVASVEDFYNCAVAFGNFQQMLADFPAEKLHETIPNFHNTPDRYRIFRETFARDPMHRAAKVMPEIEFVLQREKEMAILQNALVSGELPLRVTHNDTKLNNVLLDAKTRKALCVIDLDTVMPGSSLYDYGDAIRFGAATAAEDEQDLSKMELDLHMFRIFTRGYIQACPGLTEKELEYMPLGAKTLTMECGIRFLTDYLDGDNYFSIHRDGHNLDRARTQFKLVADMEEKWDEMQKIVKEEMK